MIENQKKIKIGGFPMEMGIGFSPSASYLLSFSLARKHLPNMVSLHVIILIDIIFQSIPSPSILHTYPTHQPSADAFSRCDLSR